MKTSTLTSISSIVLLLAGSLGSGCASPAESKRGEVMFANYCAQCHGANGQGQESIGAPAIAGLPQWYVLQQLHNFREGVRGTHFDDIEGMRMRPMSLTLSSEKDVVSTAAYVASLPTTAPAPVLADGHAEVGKGLFATCTACHGPEAAGNEALGAPPLVGQQDWYLVRQLGKFKAGVRGANPKDTKGMTMRPMATALADEQAMKDVVAYIQTLRK